MNQTIKKIEKGVVSVLTAEGIKFRALIIIKGVRYKSELTDSLTQAKIARDKILIRNYMKPLYLKPKAV
jgi:hypothetical protein